MVPMLEGPSILQSSLDARGRTAVGKSVSRCALLPSSQVEISSVASGHGGGDRSNLKEGLGRVRDLNRRQ